MKLFYRTNYFAMAAVRGERQRGREGERRVLSNSVRLSLSLSLSLARAHNPRLYSCTVKGGLLAARFVEPRSALKGGGVRTNWRRNGSGRISSHRRQGAEPGEPADWLRGGVRKLVSSARGAEVRRLWWEGRGWEAVRRVRRVQPSH